ncbi:hypothetical protein QZH41_018989, partial [Actinostola sp. cb2023]
PHIIQLRTKADPCMRLVNARNIGLNFGDVMIDIGTVRLTVLDLWTLINPNQVNKLIQNWYKFPRGFTPGWLSDTVIEGFLWQLHLHYGNIFSADASMCQIVQNNSSTKRLWHGETFKDTNKIFIPMNVHHSHWSLLVIDRTEKTRYYFDPMQGKGRTISTASQPSLALLIRKISCAADKRTGWESKKWPCIEPEHFKQTDSFNCGVLVCLFAHTSICEGTEIMQEFNVTTERDKIASQIFGFCYDDTNERNTGICKVCKDAGDDDKDWLGCDVCGQFFHATCLNLDYAENVTNFFKCPE